MLTRQQINEALLAGKVIVNIGQINDADKRKLDGLAKKGKLDKWRGFWHPVPGASWGMGQPKTCWALPGIRDCT